MCGRRLLEPKRADGSSHVWAAEADDARNRFLKTFNWGLVKNYTVDILLENWVNAFLGMGPAWDEEVEIYDIRDYISVVVSGILAKAQKLCKLQVRLCLSEFQWSEEQIFSNSRLLFEPFERLRNVRQVSLGGVFQGRPEDNSMLLVSPHSPYTRGLPDRLETCSVPSLPTNDPILVAGMPAFDAYVSEWKRKISSKSSTAVTEEPPIRRMFAEFRNFYTQLSSYVPDVMYRSGKHTFLHRARVAREKEDVIVFRDIQNELVHYWTAYLLNEEDRKRKMNTILENLLKSDKYPSHVWEETSSRQMQLPSINSSSVQSPIHLDSNRMASASIPTRGSSVNSQREMEMQGYREAELRVIRAWTQNVDQSVGRQRTLLPRPGPIDSPTFLAECSAKLANVNEANMRQQARWQQTGTTRDGWEQFDALMCGEDSSPSTIAADDTYNVAFENHYIAPEGDPGPSTKRRRIDYAPQSEMQRSPSTSGPIYPYLPYSGKGKGKAPVQARDEVGSY
ncbi:hypothetical protein A1F94_010607 [Pyrenophora tritici-repentis]|nr:hypothetical protein A1F94_010607 [Pyrenophora tritici-repentis]